MCHKRIHWHIRWQSTLQCVSGFYSNKNVGDESVSCMWCTRLGVCEVDAIHSFHRLAVVCRVDSMFTESRFSTTSRYLCDQGEWRSTSSTLRRTTDVTTEAFQHSSWLRGSCSANRILWFVAEIHERVRISSATPQKQCCSKTSRYVLSISKRSVENMLLIIFGTICLLAITLAVTTVKLLIMITRWTWNGVTCPRCNQSNYLLEGSRKNLLQ